MFAMTLYKCARTLYHTDHRMPIWKLFLRDGVVWFVLVFGTQLIPLPRPLHIDGIGSEAAGGSELLIWTMRRETLKQVLLMCVLSSSFCGPEISFLLLLALCSPALV